MARYILRPNGDDKTQWTEDPAGTGYTLLDDAVTYPSTPTTGSDRITVAASSQTASYDVETFTKGATETVVCARAWAYSKAAASSNHTVQLWDKSNTTPLATSSVTSTSFGWTSASYAGDLTQTQIDSLQVYFLSAGTGTQEIDCAYIEIITEDLSDSYSRTILNDTPALYWKLSETAGITVADSSGNGRHGALYTNQTLGSTTGVTQGSTYVPPAQTGGKSLSINGHWTEPTPTQDYPGTGIRADSYKPYTPGSIRSFEAWLYKTEERSFATIFSAAGMGSGTPSATNSPEPTWEMGANGMMRFYPNVETFPLGWVDWGTANTGYPDSDFDLNSAMHIVCIYNDTTGQAEWYVNGESQGRQSSGYLSSALAYNTVRDRGVFQVGWRGGYTTPNTEVYGGLIDEIAVYEYELTQSQIIAHYQAGIPYHSPLVRVNSTPIRLNAVVEPPGGRSYRWADDEPNAANVPDGLSFSTTIPGGFESLDLTLPRKANTTYADVQQLSNLRILGNGDQVAWEGRIEGAARSSGDDRAISVQAVGWQAALEDDQTAVMPYVDRDLGHWFQSAADRRVNLYGTGFYDVVNSGEVVAGGTYPAIRLGLDSAAATGEHTDYWYDSKTTLSSIYYRAVWRNTGTAATWVGGISGASTPTATTTTTGTDVITGSAGTTTVTETAVSGYRYAFAYFAAFLTTLSATDRDLQLSNVAVYGNHGLTKRGTEPAAGFYASDIIGHAVATWAPTLSRSIDQTGFVIPHAAYLDYTTAAAIIRDANRFHLNDWGVWDDKTFHYYERGARGRTWRARVREANLQEAGPQMDKVWNGVLVSYPDVDGTTRTVGPTGSVADATSTYLTDSDPTNPINAAGLRRWVKLDVSVVTTQAGAIEIGKRFLLEANQLNGSGQAVLTGTVEDDKGIKRPAWQVRAGDYISFIDASDTSPRKIVRTSYDADSLTNSIDLDAPPEGLDALLERLSVVLVPLGL